MTRPAMRAQAYPRSGAIGREVTCPRRAEDQGPEAEASLLFWKKKHQRKDTKSDQRFLSNQKNAGVLLRIFLYI